MEPMTTRSLGVRWPPMPCIVGGRHDEHVQRVDEIKPKMMTLAIGA
jgi:hypothetical protein